jgi:hypothetical protein
MTKGRKGGRKARKKDGWEGKERKKEGRERKGKERKGKEKKEGR